MIKPNNCYVQLTLMHIIFFKLMTLGLVPMTTAVAYVTFARFTIAKHYL